MKVFQLSHSDLNGGAARAAYRIHQAARRAGIDSSLWVNEALSDDWTVKGPVSKWRKVFNAVRPSFGRLLARVLKTDNRVVHSPALLPSVWPKRLQALDMDVLHLHWLNNEMCSIADMGRLRQPIVWTLHDMWAFCGAEHYTQERRWRDGYTDRNRPDHERGFDLNRWVWQRKRRYWRHPVQLVTPSHWLAACVHDSRLFSEWPVTVIPNAIDTDLWRPIESSVARQLLRLPTDVPLLLFGAMDGVQDSRKGFDLLQAALQHLHGQIPGLELLVLGQGAPKKPPDIGFPVHYTGYLSDNLSLCVLYSAADLIVIPSRQDNLPNTGLEAHACGTPAVAFDVCGLPDIIAHRQTGYLARAFDSEDLAQGIRWVLTDPQRCARLSQAARARALQRWRYEVVAQQYQAVYQRVLAEAGDVSG